MFSFQNIIASPWPTQCKSMDGVLYDRDHLHELVKNCEKLKWRRREFSASSFHFMLLKLCKDIPKSLFHFFERSGIDPTYAADSTGIVWTWRLWVTKIVSKWHVSGKCEHGVTNSVLITILFQFQWLFSGRIKVSVIYTYKESADFLSVFLTSVDKVEE